MTEDSKAVEAVARDKLIDLMLRAFVDTEAGQSGCWALIKSKEPGQSDTMRVAMNAAIAAHLAHLETEGMVVAPREPTEAMYLRGREPILARDCDLTQRYPLGTHMRNAGQSGWATDDEQEIWEISKGQCATMVWRAMIDSIKQE